MKIYIAGKIAGDRRYRAKFREAAKALEAAGHVVLNPATLPEWCGVEINTMEELEKAVAV